MGKYLVNLDHNNFLAKIIIFFSLLRRHLQNKIVTRRPERLNLYLYYH